MNQLLAAIRSPMRRPTRSWEMPRLPAWAVSWLQVGPLALILGVLLAAPIVLFLVVSFFDYDRTGIYPAFMLDNYRELFFSASTLRVYVNSLKLAAIVWVITLLLGFNLAYFLIFHVRSGTIRAVLFLLCAIPFWTSGIIRTIAWIPFLGRNGAFNQAVMGLGFTNAPLEFLLFSDFAVVLTYVHLFTLLMVGPFQMLGLEPSLFTSALGAQLTWTLPFGVFAMFAVVNRFDRSYEEAASDLGASAWQRLIHVTLPILAPGIIGVAMGAFTLSYDEYARTTLTIGPKNTLPREIYALISSATSPTLFAIGTLTTVVSFVVIGITLVLVLRMQRRRAEARPS